MKTVFVADHATVLERPAKKGSHWHVRTKRKDRLRSLGTYETFRKACEVAVEFSEAYTEDTVNTLIRDYTGVDPDEKVAHIKEVLEEPDQPTPQLHKAMNVATCHLIVRKAEEHLAYMANYSLDHERVTDVNVTVEDMRVIIDYANDLIALNGKRK